MDDGKRSFWMDRPVFVTGGLAYFRKMEDGFADNI